jgi:hypothetical protein
MADLFWGISVFFGDNFAFGYTVEISKIIETGAEQKRLVV